MKQYSETKAGLINWVEVREGQTSSGCYKKGRTAKRTLPDGTEETYSPYDELLAQEAAGEIVIERPAPPTQQEILDEALQRGLEAQKSAANQARQLMLSPAYSELDQASFDKQEAEANLVLAGDTTGLLLLPGMASERGITLLDMANKVKQKADQFAQLTGLVLGARQRIEKQMKAAHKADDLPELERLIAVAKVEILKPLSAQA